MNSPKTFSFAVGSKYGPRSWKWILTIDKDDLYIAAWALRKRWKISLHRSGRWHVKTVDGSSDAPLIRVHAKDAHAYVRGGGLAIVIPDDCLRKASNIDKATVVDHWLPRPPYDGFVEVVIGDWRLERDGPDQPLANLGFDLFFYLTTETTGAFVGHRAIPPESTGGKIYAADLTRIKARLPKPILLDSPERRGAILSRTEGGAIRAMEIAVD